MCGDRELVGMPFAAQPVARHARDVRALPLEFALHDEVISGVSVPLSPFNAHVGAASQHTPEREADSRLQCPHFFFVSAV